MADAKWTGILSTTERLNDIGILNVRQGNLNSEIVEFQIIQNNKPYNLTGYKVYFCTNFGLSAVEKQAVIKDATNGIVTFTFNDKSMQEVGRQLAYFQITKDEVLVDSTQDFEFRIQSSILSRNMEAGSYIESFENVLKTLGDNAAYSLTKELGKTNEQLKQTMSQTEFDSWVATLLDGGPSIFMETLAALNTAYPNGSSGVALVRETNPSKIFVWNGTSWKDYGDYQGLELKTNSVTPPKTSFFTQNKKNLIHPLDFISGYVDIQGKVIAAGASKVSKTLQKLNPNSIYRLQSRRPLTNATIYFAEYNPEGVFTRRFNAIQTLDDTIVVTFLTGPNDANYRLSCIAGMEMDLFLHEGVALLPFEEPLLLDNKFLEVKETTASITTNQTDFVSLLRTHNSVTKKLKAQVIGDRNFWVYQPIANEKYVGHQFSKDGNDDFVVYGSAVIGKFIENEFVIDQYMMAGSNKEFAVRVRPNGSSGEFKWLPEHESTGTAFSINQSILFDGREMVGELATGPVVEVNSVSLIQEMKLVYPGEELATAHLSLITTINNQGVSYTGKVKWLKDTEIERGYVAMLPTIVPPVDTLRTSSGKDYNALLSTGMTIIDEIEPSTSYAFLNKGGINPNTSYVLAQTIHNSDKTFRVGQEGRKEPNPIWLEHRSSTVQKLYPQIYQDHLAKNGDVLEFGATLYVGILPMANSLLF